MEINSLKVWLTKCIKMKKKCIKLLDKTNLDSPHRAFDFCVAQLKS